MNTEKCPRSVSENTKKDFASAWRELNRRHSLVRSIFLGWWFLWVFVIQQVCRRNDSITELMVMFGIGSVISFFIHKPLISVLLVSVISYATFNVHFAELRASRNVVWLFVIAALWLVVAASEIYFCLFRCPNCHKRYFSYAPRSTGDTSRCEHCKIAKGTQYLPVV